MSYHGAALMSALKAAARQNPTRTVDNRSWGATFPEEVNTWSDSQTFISRCMYISLCHIIANRKLLPQNNFKKRNIDGSTRAYVMNSSEILGARFIQKFKGVTEALSKKYLREIILVVSPTEDDENDAIEMYCWRVRYADDGEPFAELKQADGTVMAALRFRGMQYLKKQVADLLLTIRSLCKTLGELPPGAFATMRITYTDRTPKGYQAPGFYRSPEDPILRSEAQEIEIGAMQTKYHGGAVYIQSVYIDDAYAVGLRLKEGMKLGNLNDSLDESFADEAGAGDEANRSGDDTNNTMERISEASEQQVNVVEVPRGPPQGSDSGTHLANRSMELENTMTKLSVVGDRGSPATFVSSEAPSPVDMPPKRTRHVRGSRVQRGKGITEQPKSPVMVSVSPVIEQSGTPKRRTRGDNTYDTPPAKKTPGFMKLPSITPKDPPRRR
ncbi:HORMA domain-containing protein [Trichostrongylus colubriformis]|uniref:HORMA domain-containing protein n=1 Tax=Trichostrongylus colubriformis TaxID=6319 RepID=A0AAN8IIQ1_TRICO